MFKISERLFVREINAYLTQSKLLMDTDGGELAYGTPDASADNAFIPNWLFLP